MYLDAEHHLELLRKQDRQVMELLLVDYTKLDSLCCLELEHQMPVVVNLITVMNIVPYTAIHNAS
jgi:hypothetical protein